MNDSNKTEDKFYVIYLCGTFGATIYRKEHKRNVFIARNVTSYYRSGEYLFFETLNEKNYGWSVIKNGFATVKHLGRKFDGHFMVKTKDGYQISFFNNRHQLLIKKHCQGYFYNIRNSALVIEDSDGRCQAFATEGIFIPSSSHCSVKDYDCMQYYPITNGSVLICMDDNRNEWAFVAKSPYYTGAVRKLGLANKRWKRFAEKNEPYQKTFWERLRDLIKNINN